MLLPAYVDQRDVPALYARIAAIYDIWGVLTESRARRRCLELAAVRDGDDVLEVAVGTGLAFRELARANPTGRVEGVDLSPGMLEKARRKVRGLPGRHRLSVGDAARLEFSDASFDVLINNYMFDLMPETMFALVLREFHRVLRPGGRLVLVNMTSPRTRANRFWHWFYERWPRGLGGCRGVEVTPHVRAAGFRGVTREFISQATFPSEVVAAIA